jgi:transposase
MQDLATIDATNDRTVRRLEVLTGPERRRSYTDGEKAKLVAETLRPGVSAASVARRYGIHPQQLYTWRRQVRCGELTLPTDDAPMFAPVMAEPEQATTAGEHGTEQEIVIELGGLRLRLGAAVPAERVAALVAALRAAR